MTNSQFFAISNNINSLVSDMRNMRLDIDLSRFESDSLKKEVDALRREVDGVVMKSLTTMCKKRRPKE